MQPEVVIAMSGGVDSSVAAALLVEQGYSVSGIMLHLWSESGMECENSCCTIDSQQEARQVARQLGFPFQVIEASDLFRQQVVQFFIDEYARGVTPNPCIQCNQFIRWGFLLQQVEQIGVKYLATGHYARIEQSSSQKFQLLRGVDAEKDQSYVLSALTQSQLAHTIFPLGDYHKSEVRQIARRYNLAIANKGDSQDLCFLGNLNYRSFLQKYVPQSLIPGKIIDQKGKTIGQHQGLAFYTIGQRKGLGIAAPLPLYVLDKDIEQNILIVSEQIELGKNEAVVDNINWISGETPQTPLTVNVKIRYKADFAEARLLTTENNQVKLTFMNSLRDITPGQRAVFYIDDAVIGSGTIVW